MEDFLKRMEHDIEHKIMSCVRGESIIKPFSQVYERVREPKKGEKKKNPPTTIKSFIYAEGERSIYEKAIAQFLLENPDFLADLKQDLNS